MAILTWFDIGMIWNIGTTQYYFLQQKIPGIIRDYIHHIYLIR